jgi:hypothetical protein
MDDAPNLSGWLQDPGNSQVHPRDNSAPAKGTRSLECGIGMGNSVRFITHELSFKLIATAPVGKVEQEQTTAYWLLIASTGWPTSGLAMFHISEYAPTIGSVAFRDFLNVVSVHNAAAVEASFPCCARLWRVADVKTHAIFEGRGRWLGRRVFIDFTADQFLNSAVAHTVNRA